MPTRKQIKEIDRIHRTYVEKIAPLIDDMDEVQGYDICPLHNEVRAIMGHLSRCFLNERLSVSTEISKALGHLDRLTLDTYKLYALYYTEIESDFEKKYRYADLSRIDDHGFYDTYFKSSFQGRGHLLEARKMESIDKKKALLAYETMYVEYHKMMDYLYEHEADMRWEKWKYRGKRIAAALGMLFVTLMSTLLGTVLLTLISHE